MKSIRFLLVLLMTLSGYAQECLLDEGNTDEVKRSVSDIQQPHSNKFALIVPSVLVGACVALLGIQIRTFQVPARRDSAKPNSEQKVQSVNDFIRGLDSEFVTWLNSTIQYLTASEEEVSGQLESFLTQRKQVRDDKGLYAGQRLIVEVIQPEFKKAQKAPGAYRFSLSETYLLALINLGNMAAVQR